MTSCRVMGEGGGPTAPQEGVLVVSPSGEKWQWGVGAGPDAGEGGAPVGGVGGDYAVGALGASPEGPFRAG